MIKYGLTCDNDHNFDGWFGSSSDFDSQRKRGLLECPVCGSSGVEKSLMSPAVVGSSSSESPSSSASSGSSGSSDSSSDSSDSSSSDVALVDSDRRELLAKMKELRDELTSKAENVGSRFADEARKIHYGESDARGIFGEADPETVEDLLDEGIPVLPLPSLPDDAN